MLAILKILTIMGNMLLEMVTIMWMLLEMVTIM